MRIVVALLGAVLGAIAGGAVAMFGGIAWGELAHVSQFEGAYAMGVVFTLTPLGMIVGALLGGWLAWRWSRPAVPAQD